MTLQHAVCCKRSSALASIFVLALGLAAAVPTPAPAEATAQAIAQFLNGPSALLARSPNGGLKLVSAVRDLVAADPATLQPVLDLLSNANRDQKSAIGAALAQAAKLVVKISPALTEEIQQAVLNTRDEDVLLAFAAALGDRPDGTVGGGGGQISPLTFGGKPTGGAQHIGQRGVNTPFFSYTSSVTGLSVLSDSSTALIAASVSP